ncbi:MAG: hypothetical protein RL375_3518, partial [Pseudomonadota bacterium]
MQRRLLLGLIGGAPLMLNATEARADSSGPQL